MISYVVLLYSKRAFVFKLESNSWHSEKLNGEMFTDLNNKSLTMVVREISDRLNYETELEEASIDFIYDQDSIQYLNDIPTIMQDFGCNTWQVLRFEPIKQMIEQKPESILDEFWYCNYFLPFLKILRIIRWIQKH